jgi:hypothetical protein
MWCSKQTQGFYPYQDYPNAPSDLVEITDEEYSALFYGRTSGKMIDYDESGRPFLTESRPDYSQALSALNSAYQADVAKYHSAFALALLSDGPSEASKIATIRAQYDSRKSQHAANIAALKSEYGV